MAVLKKIMCFLRVTVLLALTGFYFQEPQTAYAEQENDPTRPDSRQLLNFGKFQMLGVADAEFPEMQKTVLLHGGKNIILPEENEGEEAAYYRTITPDKEEKDFPLTGCRTISVEMFTGGANCCLAYYILSSCDNEDYAAFLSSPKGGMGKPMVLDHDKGLNGYLVSDNAFMYYDAPGKDDEHSIFLSGAESPLPSRYIVFDGGSWRIDKVGEFKELYDKERDQIRADNENAPVANIILVGYYSYMFGEDPAIIIKEIQETLPPAYADLADKIFADIENAVKKMSPLENLALTAR